jgi:hypothetical protein
MNVAFLIYGRPELTARVFAEIAKAKPSKLLMVADEPKSGEERAKCESARGTEELPHRIIIRWTRGVEGATWWQMRLDR